MLIPTRLHPFGYSYKPPVTAKSYVQNGLVAMWDGIENAGWGVHDASATVWKELISGTVSNDIASKGSFTSDSFNFTSRSIADLNTLAMRNAVGTSIFTAEITFKPNTYNAGIYLWGSPNGFQLSVLSNYAVRFFSSNTMIAQTEAQYAYSNAHTYSISRSNSTAKAFADGIQIGNDTECAAMTAPTNGLDIMISEVNNIRIYSRAITASEIAANYAVDVVRFNLPTT